MCSPEFSLQDNTKNGEERENRKRGKWRASMSDALTMRKRKSRAVKCWFFGMTAIATMKTQQLWLPALGQYRKGWVISQTWTGEALTEPCLSELNTSSWFLGGEITVFSCVAQVSPADSTGQFQTIVRQMVLVKLSGSQNETKGHEYKSRPCMELRAKRSGKETWEEGVENNQNALCTCMKQPNTNLTKIRS